MKINTPEVLLVEELKDLYDAEKRLVRAIPKMAKAASNEELRSALMEHLDVTKNQVTRLEQVFEILGVPAKAKPCAGMKGIIEEGEEVTSQDTTEELLDVAITGAASRVEHYEMAGYAAARTIAEHLGNQEVVNLLQETWDEENEADEKLSQLASQLFGSSGEEMEEDEEVEAVQTSRKPKAKRSAS